MELNINQVTLAWLNSVNGPANGKIKYLLDYFNSPEEIWNNFKQELKNLNGLTEEAKNSLLERKSNFPQYLTNKLNEENAKLVTCFDDDYPKRLKNTENYPYILYKIKSNL